MIQLDYHSMWKVDVKTGVVSYPSRLKKYKTNRTVLSAKRAAAEPNEVTFHNVTGTGSLQWLFFYYKPNNPEAGEAYVYR